MADYKAMYLEMVRASEKAIRILIAAQQKCEDMYIEADPEESGTESAAICGPDGIFGEKSGTFLKNYVDKL